MQKEFFIGVMVCKPAKGSPGESMKNSMMSDKTPYCDMICRVSIIGHGDKVKLEYACDEDEHDGPAGRLPSA